MELIRINGFGLYGLTGAFIGRVALLPKSFPEFAVRMTFGCVFSFTLTLLAGPLLCGIFEANLGPPARCGTPLRGPRRGGRPGRETLQLRRVLSAAFGTAFPGSRRHQPHHRSRYPRAKPVRPIQLHTTLPLNSADNIV